MIGYRNKHAVTRWDHELGVRPGDVVTLSSRGLVCHRRAADLDEVAERWVARTFGGLGNVYPLPTLADYELWKKTIEQVRESQILEEFEDAGSFLVGVAE